MRVYKITKEITDVEIYGQDYTVPNGYEIEEFRPPKKGEKFLSKSLSFKTLGVSEASYDHYDDGPRLIIIPKPKSLCEHLRSGNLKSGNWYRAELKHKYCSAFEEHIFTPCLTSGKFFTLAGFELYESDYYCKETPKQVEVIVK